MTDEQKNEYLEFAKLLAEDAGTIMKKYFGNNPDHRFKDDNTIVTIADEEINALVIERVGDTYPEHKVDGEEASTESNSSFVWACDPIDGTNPFAMGLPVSVFSLALVVEGVPEVGVIYAPFSQRLYTATKNGGAYVNGIPAFVNKRGLEKKSRVNVDWWNDADYDVMTVMHQIAYETGVYVLCPGSTTHAAALVAGGEFVASVFPGTKGKNVDIAAAKVIVEEAGGRVTDLFGSEQRYDQDINGAIVSNGIVHDEIVERMKQLRIKEEV